MLETFCSAISADVKRVKVMWGEYWLPTEAQPYFFIFSALISDVYSFLRLVSGSPVLIGFSASTTFFVILKNRN